LIKWVYDIAVVVSDAKKSAEWYREKLGFEVREQEGHWITVAPKGAETVLHLCEITPLEPGVTGINFLVDDLEGLYQELSGKGVEFTAPLEKTRWGLLAIFKDPDGNEIQLSQFK
jgi:catechol 2,3-dioxygenase-like lactoylglutathione lyase family enzyme